MLQQLIIKNFQCHKSVIIDFDSKVTTIVGPSDVGKSAVVRALRWLMLNKPDGHSFRAADKEFVSVKVVIDDHVIVRKRSDRENIYKLNGETLKSFGRGDVPDEVKKILNVSADNFQLQHDGAFWFSMSGGNISKALNAVMDLEIMDKALAEAKTRVRRVDGLVDGCQELVAESTSQLEELGFVPELQKDWHKTEDMINRAKDLSDDVEDLADMIKRHKRLSAVTRHYSKMLDDWTHVAIIWKDVEKQSKAIESLQSKIDTLESLSHKLRDKRKCLQEWKARLPANCPTCGKLFSN